MIPDPRNCTPESAAVCHADATCAPVTPYVCSSTRAMNYRCDCNQGFTGNGIDCTGIHLQLNYSQVVCAKLFKTELVILLFYRLLYTFSKAALLQPPFAFLMIIGFSL